MTNIKRNWNLLSEEQRRASIKEIIDFFKTERDEEIGMIAAENILDHFLQTVGIQLYNKGIEDSVGFFKNGIENLELDIDSLKK